MKILEQTVYNYISKQNLTEPGMRIVIGVSGGADSVCLLRVLHALRGALSIPEDGLAVAHVNHGIRGAEAERDARFTETLCADLRVPFYLYRKDIPAYAHESGMSVEEAGRECRYACMEELRNRLGFDRIAVAHNQEDMAETVLFHMIRGSGLKGLAGIAADRDFIIRPLLAVSRSEIEHYLGECGQTFCFDSTNDDQSYARNRIRHSILPVMRELNDRAVEHICQTAQDAERSYAYVHAQAAKHFNTFVKRDAGGRTAILPTANLYRLSPVLQEHIVSEAIALAAGKQKDISRAHIRSVTALLYQDTGNMVHLPYGLCARRSYDKLIITDREEETPAYRIPISENGDYDIPNRGRLSVTFGTFSGEQEIPKKNYTKLLDYDKIKGKLCIRTPETGDYIVIDRAGSTKKLSRVFIDAKIDRAARIGWPVLACGHEVIWAVGLRFSPVYYVSGDTEHTLLLQYKSKGACYGTKD